MTNAAQLPEPAGRPNLDQVIGSNVHRLMWDAHESQSKLAPQWGMTQAALSLKLRGKRPWFAEEIDAAARHFRVTRDALFTRPEPVGPTGLEPMTSTVESGRLAPVTPIRKAAAA
jgi:hypothetical protein